MASMLCFDSKRVEALPQTCTLCRATEDPEETKERRARWGCDAELTDEQWRENDARSDGSAVEFTPCYRCDGKDPDCELCEGSNVWRLYRCPHACVEEWHRDVCHGVALQESGILPFAGGWMDQTFLFIQASRRVAEERQAIIEARRQEAQDRADQEFDRKRRGG